MGKKGKSRGGLGGPSSFEGRAQELKGLAGSAVLSARNVDVSRMTGKGAKTLGSKPGAGSGFSARPSGNLDEAAPLAEPQRQDLQTYVIVLKGVRPDGKDSVVEVRASLHADAKISALDAWTEEEYAEKKGA